MRRLPIVAALLLLPSLAMAQPPSPAPAQAAPAAKPQAPKMVSDEVMALLEKGEVFFLDVREPKELEELGTLEGKGYKVMAFCGLNDYTGKSGKKKVFPKQPPPAR